MGGERVANGHGWVRWPWQAMAARRGKAEHGQGTAGAMARWHSRAGRRWVARRGLGFNTGEAEMGQRRAPSGGDGGAGLTVERV